MTISNLNIFVPNTIADVAPLNENFEMLRLHTNNNEAKLGDLGLLSTNNKSNLVAALNDAIETANSTIIPAGTIISSGNASAPEGYLLCNGAEISRDSYTDLFAAIGTAFGEGDTFTTFALPDFRGVFLRGQDAGKGYDTSRVLGTYQSDGAPNITGNVCVNDSKDANRWTPNGAFRNSGTYFSRYGSTEAGSAPYVDFNASRSSSVYQSISEVRPKNVAVNFYIKY